MHLTLHKYSLTAAGLDCALAVRDPVPWLCAAAVWSFFASWTCPYGLGHLFTKLHAPTFVGPAGVCDKHVLACSKLALLHTISILSRLPSRRCKIFTRSIYSRVGKDAGAYAECRKAALLHCTPVKASAGGKAAVSRSAQLSVRLEFCHSAGPQKQIASTMAGSKLVTVSLLFNACAPKLNSYPPCTPGPVKALPQQEADEHLRTRCYIQHVSVCERYLQQSQAAPRS